MFVPNYPAHRPHNSSLGWMKALKNKRGKSEYRAEFSTNQKRSTGQGGRRRWNVSAPPQAPQLQVGGLGPRSGVRVRQLGTDMTFASGLSLAAMYKICPCSPTTMDCTVSGKSCSAFSAMNSNWSLPTPTSSRLVGKAGRRRKAPTISPGSG